VDSPKFKVGDTVRITEACTLEPPHHDRSKPMTVIDVFKNGKDFLYLVDRCICGRPHCSLEYNGINGPWWWEGWLEVMEQPITPEEIAQARSLPLPEEAFRFVTRRNS